MRYDAWDKRIQFRGTIVRTRDGHEGHKTEGDTKGRPVRISSNGLVLKAEHTRCERGLQYSGKSNYSIVSRMCLEITNFYFDYYNIRIKQ